LLIIQFLEFRPRGLKRERRRNWSVTSEELLLGCLVIKLGGPRTRNGLYYDDHSLTAPDMETTPFSSLSQSNHPKLSMEKCGYGYIGA
jgi:hypothetical protein